MAASSGNGLGGQSLEGVPDILGDRQAPDSHVEIPEGKLPGTGQMTPRSAGCESGKKGRSTPRLDRAPGIRKLQQRLDGVLEAGERGFRTQSPRKTGWQHRVGEVAGGRTTHAEPEHRAWCSAHSESWGLQSGPEEERSQGAKRASGGRPSCS